MEASKSGDDLYEYVVGLMQLAQSTEALRITKDAIEHNLRMVHCSAPSVLR